jgi:transcriptional regulator with XRE-family HTH domain
MLSGDRLKFLRYMHGKTQKEVAEWCNVSSRYIGMVEHGDEYMSEETYNAFLNCIYGVGKPLPSTPRANQKKANNP